MKEPWRDRDKYVSLIFMNENKLLYLQYDKDFDNGRF